MRIRELRLAKKMSQTQLARKARVSQQAVAKWEAGDASPLAGKLPALAAALGCSIDELYGKEG